MKVNNIPSFILNDNDQSPTESTLIHAYPGSMPAYLASRLAERYSSGDDLVFDPFCGSGVVLLESAKLGRKVAGVDLLETAINIASAAFCLSEDILLTWRSIHENALEKTSLFTKNEVIFDSLSDSHRELSYWFHKETFIELIALYQEISNLKDQNDKRLFSLILSSSLMSLSKRASRGVLHWGWIADNVKPNALDLIQTDLFDVISKRVSKLTDFIKATGSHKLLSKAKSEIFCHNWVKNERLPRLREGEVDLLLTSPPYPYSIDYTLALRLSFYLFEIPFQEIQSNEIGARFKRHRKLRSQQYLDEMKLALNRSSSLVKKSGHAVFVLPHPEEYKSVINLSIDEWIEFFQENMNGNWSIKEIGFRDCINRRIVHKSKDTRQELIAAFQREVE